MAHDFEKKWRSEDVKLQENVDFSALLLSNRVLSGLTKAGFKKPSPIQLEAIPIAKVGKDVLIQAKSGTGKTLVFVITALEMLKRKLFRPQVMVIVPTREIAAQICSVVKSVGSTFPKLTCCSFIGGLSVSDDKDKALTCQIVVGTPGRVAQLVTEKYLPVNSIRLLVFDEADCLCHISFKQEINDIVKLLPDDKQVIAASATYPARIRSLLFKYLREPHLACLNSNEIALLGIVHYAKSVKSSPMPLILYKTKLAVLEDILKNVKFTQCLVFCNSIARVEVVCMDVKKWGFSATYISSAKEQCDRLKAINRLKHFKCKVLVTSDITARGIDAENVDIVINFDLPFGTETYMHRVGRAGRYGSIGVAISIIEERQLLYLERMEKSTSFKTFELPEPVPEDLIQRARCEEGEYIIKVSEEPPLFEIVKESPTNGVKTDNSVNGETDGEKELGHLDHSADDTLDESEDPPSAHQKEISNFSQSLKSSSVGDTNGNICQDVGFESGSMVVDVDSQEGCDHSSKEDDSGGQADKACSESKSEGLDDSNTLNPAESLENTDCSANKVNLNDSAANEAYETANVKNVRQCINANTTETFDDNTSEFGPSDSLSQFTAPQNKNCILKNDIDYNLVNDTESNGITRNNVNELNFNVKVFIDQHESNRRAESSPEKTDEFQLADNGEISTSAVYRLNVGKSNFFYKVLKKYQENNEGLVSQHGTEEVNKSQNEFEEITESQNELEEIKEKQNEIGEVKESQNDIKKVERSESEIEEVKISKNETEDMGSKNEIDEIPLFSSQNKDYNQRNSSCNVNRREVVFYSNSDTSQAFDSPYDEQQASLQDSQEISGMSNHESTPQLSKTSSCPLPFADMFADKLVTSNELVQIYQTMSSDSESGVVRSNEDNNLGDSLYSSTPKSLLQAVPSVSSISSCSYSYTCSESSSYSSINSNSSRHSAADYDSNCSSESSSSLTESLRHDHSYSHSNHRSGTKRAPLGLKSSGNRRGSRKIYSSKNAKECNVYLKNAQCDGSRSHSQLPCSYNSANFVQQSAYSKNKKDLGRRPTYDQCRCSTNYSSLCNKKYKGKNPFCSHLVSTACSRQQATACGWSCFQSSKHRCHSQPFCNENQVCSDWYKTFYYQWLHIQNCVSSALL